MAATTSSASQPASPTHPVCLKMDRFEAITSLLVSLMLLLGLLFAMMLVMWLLRGATLTESPVRMERTTVPSAAQATAMAFKPNFESPRPDEVVELVQPTMAETLEALTTAVSTVSAQSLATNTVDGAGTDAAGDIGPAIGTGWSFRGKRARRVGTLGNHLSCDRQARLCPAA